MFTVKNIVIFLNYLKHNSLKYSYLLYFYI
jgi:hypothetical protein